MVPARVGSVSALGTSQNAIKATWKRKVLLSVVHTNKVATAAVCGTYAPPGGLLGTT